MLAGGPEDSKKRRKPQVNGNSPVEGLSDVAPLAIPWRILQSVHRRCNFKHNLKISRAGENNNTQTLAVFTLQAKI